MVRQTESPGQGSGAPGGSTRGATVAILATAPRPGLVLRELCPPLTQAEAAALQTAWLKHIVRELPGASVYLYGRPADALAMLRYFAGPGVELREWHGADHGRGALDAAAAVALELFSQGHGPVLVRSAQAPEPSPDDVLTCLRAAERGERVWAADQRGAPWLLALPSPEAAEQLRGPAGAETARALARRGPWARSVQNADDLALLWCERTRSAAGGAPRVLPVRNLQAALQWYEAMFDATTVAAGSVDSRATIETRDFRLQLDARGPDFAANGLLIPLPDLEPMHDRLRACVAEGDGPARRVDGASDFSATDLDGNRLTFAASPGAR